jgi:hypothetical protein
MEFKTFLANNPNAALTPEGFQKVLGFMNMGADQQLQKQQAFSQWAQDKSPAEYQQFEPQWNAKINGDLGNNISTYDPATGSAMGAPPVAAPANGGGWKYIGRVNK